LEANYDEDMLHKGSYPYHLKRRISGGQGHLSNRQALELFMAHRPSFMTHLLLAHLSHNNNDPDLVQGLFNGQSGGIRVVVASRYEETAVYSIQGAHGDHPLPWVHTPATREAGPPATAVDTAASPQKARRRATNAKASTNNPLQLPLF
jgi:hypothetical protein